MMDIQTATHVISKYNGGDNVLYYFFGVDQEAFSVPSLSLFKIRPNGTIQKPRFVDMDENFEFLTSMKFIGYSLKDPITENIYKEYVRNPRYATDILSLVDKVIMSVSSNYDLSEEACNILEAHLLNILVSEKDYFGNLALALHCINGNRRRFSSGVVRSSGLNTNNMAVVSAVWNSFSMLYCWCFMQYAYERFVKFPSILQEALGVTYNH